MSPWPDEWILRRDNSSYHKRHPVKGFFWLKIKQRLNIHGISLIWPLVTLMLAKLQMQLKEAYVNYTKTFGAVLKGLSEMSSRKHTCSLSTFLFEWGTGLRSVQRWKGLRSHLTHNSICWIAYFEATTDSIELDGVLFCPYWLLLRGGILKSVPWDTREKLSEKCPLILLANYLSYSAGIFNML
jgi:hypothetical protein